MRRIYFLALVAGGLSCYVACGGDDTSTTSDGGAGDGSSSKLDGSVQPGMDSGMDGTVAVIDSGSDAGNQTDASDAGNTTDANDGAAPPPPTTGLTIWLAGDNGTSLDGGTPFDGGDAGPLNTVLTWLDKSGSGNLVYQADTTLQPALVPAAVNSKPALRFYGGTKLVGTSVDAWDFGTGSVSWFYVAKSENAAPPSFNSNRVFGTLVNSNPFSGLLAGVGSGGLPYAGYRNNVDNFTVDPTPATSTWVIIDSARVGNQTSIYRNGVEVGFTSGGAVDIQGDEITVGAERSGGVEYFTGDIAEIMIYSRAISTNERRTVENYLSQKYGFALHTCANVTGNLAGWYKGELDATDATATNNGSLNGNVFFAPGVVGDSFVFTNGSYVEVPNSASLNFAGSFTLETWMQASALGGRLVDKITAGGQDGYLLDTAGGKLRMIVGGTTASSVASLPTNAWVHAVGVFTKTGTGAGTITMYVNGAGDTPVVVGVDSAPTNAFPVRFGIDSGFNNGFAGRMDDTRIWNRALTANEIQSLYASGPSGKCL